MEIASCFDYRYILVLTSGGSLLFGDFAIFECLLNKFHPFFHNFSLKVADHFYYAERKFLEHVLIFYSDLLSSLIYINSNSAIIVMGRLHRQTKTAFEVVRISEQQLWQYFKIARGELAVF